MNVSLRPDLEEFINERVQCGRYRSSDEVLNHALDLLKAHEDAEHRLEMLLQEAEDSGPPTEMTAEDWTDIEREGLKQLRSGKSA